MNTLAAPERMARHLPETLSHATVASVSLSGVHEFSKPCADSITLLAGLGVSGDAHCGVTVQHRSRVAVNPDQPNLRQVHLLPAELFAELAPQGFTLAPGDLGENITTAGIDLLALPCDTVLHIGPAAAVRVTGLRNPCAQIDTFRKGLVSYVVERAADGSLVRKAGVMGVVLQGGEVRPGDAIVVELPPQPHRVLEKI